MIFYFSSTGNTRWAAQQLSKATGEQLVSMADHPTGKISPKLADGERVGFCFPVHGWRPHVLVRAFVARLHLAAGDHYVYALCTAGDNIGETIDLLEEDLHRRGIALDSAFSLIMPESYVGLPFMDVDTQDKEQAKIREAAKRLEAYTADILNRTKGVRQLDRGRWPRINSRVLGGYFANHLITDKPFHVEADSCSKCGTCASVCPVHDITGGPGQLPRWRHNGSCLTCFACYHHCPHHAIEYGRRTQHKGQYYFGRNQKQDNKTNKEP